MLETILLFTTLALTFFLPGWLLLRVLFGRHFTLLEECLYALALGLTSVDALVLVLNRFSVPLTFTTLSLTLTIFTLGLGGIFFWQKRRIPNVATQDSEQLPLDLPSRTWLLLLGMLAVTIILKAYYLVPAGLPTATDMGHHMYWSQSIVINHTLPVYQKSEIGVDPTTGISTITPPSPIADFIIGEHIPFGVIAILSGLPLIGSFPVLMLLLINIASLLALVALTIRLGHNTLSSPERTYFVLGTFLVLGPLFTLASPQAKFVSGGVVGNLFGNFLIPLILLALYLGLSKHRATFLALGILLMGTLMYTHHLSTLVLGFLLLGTALIATVSVWDTLLQTLKTWVGLFLKPPVLVVIIGIVVFLVSIAVPSYLDRAAIDSAIGSPVKTTRTGLSFAQVSNSIGIVKTAFALAGFFALLFAWQRFRKADIVAWSLVVSWGGMLALMTLKPEFLFLDIPSNRVGSYLVYPTALLAGYAVAQLAALLVRQKETWYQTLFFPVLLVLIVANGLFENGASLLEQGKRAEVQEVFVASRFLSNHTSAQDIILKDHNYLPADAWMKLFFLRDYSYPLSRGLFSRYSETGNRKERCTLVMIASPNGEEAKKCFDSTGTNYIVVNPTYDAVQFEKSSSFAKVYSSTHVAVFKRVQ